VRLAQLVLLGIALAAIAGTAHSSRATGSAAVPSRPLVTGVTDPALFASPTAAEAFRRVKAAGASTVLLQVDWSRIAPNGVNPPGQFEATDPGDPHYRWAPVDREVNLAVRAGLLPMLALTFAPRWAQPKSSDVAYQPDPTAYGEFAQAAATRFDGKYNGLPRVRYWQAWNEPNITTFLQPQFMSGQPFSPGWYRRMVNAFADSVHAAAPGNIVIAGAVAPFADRGVGEVPDWGPLSFMRDLLCLSPKLRPTCDDRVTFDVWSTHPYTSGGPTHHAYYQDDVSLGDLPKMHRVLLAAQRAHHIRLTRAGLGFWVTEFSWDSAPPDRQAVPMDTLRQWIPQALHVMWQNGVTHVTWFTLHDDPMSSSPYQSGLYFNGGSLARDRAKPILANFRFPVVVEPQAGGIRIWGRTPGGVAGGVVLQTTTPQGWKRFASSTADRYGIFQGTIRFVHLGRYVRAVLTRTGDSSGRYPVAAIADHFYNPFGTTPPLEPGG
jgi:hypothetical protein